MKNLLLILQNHPHPPHPCPSHNPHCHPMLPFPEWLLIGLAITAVIFGVYYLKRKENENNK